MVDQELAFCKDVSVAENRSWTHYPRKLGVMVDKVKMARRAHELLGKIGVSLDVSRPMLELSTAQEQRAADRDI
jgi:ABC-type sugar transport system ATPase subunit